VTDRLTVALAQINLLVGDVQGNLARMRQEMQRGCAAGVQLTIFPELALSGYPPEDLLLHRGMRSQVDTALAQLCEASAQSAGSCGIVLGYPEYDGPAGSARIYNAAALIDGGRQLANYRKHALPNYRVFDEKRYFTPGAAACVVNYRGFRVGLLVCEDIWESEPVQAAKAAGAELLLVINASPYEIHKQREREQVLRARIAEVQLPAAYVNLLGGQDELIFDGNSFAMDAAGEVTLRAPAFAEGLFVVSFERDGGTVTPRAAPQPGLPVAITPELSDEASVYAALVLGVRDYVNKHGFPGVVMGLSGGVDSALTLAIAVDALGAERVQAVMMPSPYTAAMSREDALAQARRLGVSYSEISIEGMFAATRDALAHEFAGRAPDATEENIQARCRGLLLMAISNKTGRMLLTTGNKSEMAVGYATLYGDMAGGFAPIKDCGKLLVYRLSRYRNGLATERGEALVIPQRVIDREPSAELRADQKDTDSLPPYEVLDPILEAFIEEDLSVDEIVGRGFDRAVVGRILDMVKRSEYKRRQAPPGVRVSRRAFGRDWRYPITNGYRR
jgi:NAD+ synthase (glutamine-hydrolysing)